MSQRKHVMNIEMKPGTKNCKKNRDSKNLVKKSFSTSNSSFFNEFQNFLKQNEYYSSNNPETFIKELDDGKTDVLNNHKNKKNKIKLSFKMPKSRCDFRKKPKMECLLKESKAKSDKATNKTNRHENMSKNAGVVLDILTQTDCDVTETTEEIEMDVTEISRHKNVSENTSQDLENIKPLPNLDNGFKNITDIKKRSIVPIVNNNYFKKAQKISNNEDIKPKILEKFENTSNEIENIKEFKICRQTEIEDDIPLSVLSAILKEKNNKNKTNKANLNEDSNDSVLASFEFITEEEAKKNGLYFLEGDSLPIMDGYFPLISKPYKHTIPTGNDYIQLFQNNPPCLMDMNKSIEPTAKYLNVYRGMGFYFTENNSDETIELQREAAKKIMKLYPKENKWHLKRQNN